jgi:phage replication-related protein YjqB (UPF0714/DUF867 family)
VESKNYQEIIDKGYRRGRDFQVSVGNLKNLGCCLLAAPHGGGIETGTSEILREVATRGEWAYYRFDGRLRTGNRRLHITSTRFDEPDLLALLPQTEFLLCFHGARGSAQRKIYVGGLYRRGRRLFLDSLNTLLGPLGFCAVDATTARHTEEINGTSRRNITNRGRLRMGVQLEFSRGARLGFFESLSRVGRKKPKAALNVLAESIDQTVRRLTRERVTE